MTWKATVSIEMIVSNAAGKICVDGKKLVALREGKFLSRNELARRAGLALSAIQRVERGRKTMVRLATVNKLAAGLGMEADAVMARVGRGTTATQTPAQAPGDSDLLSRAAELVSELQTVIIQLRGNPLRGGFVPDHTQGKK